MLKKGRKEAELSPADEGSVEGLINYFIVKNKNNVRNIFSRGGECQKPVEGS